MATVAAPQSKATGSPPEKADVLAGEEDWEFQLDAIGLSAPVSELQEMLERAPNPQSETARVLAGFIAANHVCELPRRSE